MGLGSSPGDFNMYSGLSTTGLGQGVSNFSLPQNHLEGLL